MDRQSLLKSSFATKSIYYENEILTSNSHTLKTIYSHLLISKNYPIKKWKDVCVTVCLCVDSLRSRKGSLLFLIRIINTPKKITPRSQISLFYFTCCLKIKKFKWRIDIRLPSPYRKSLCWPLEKKGLIKTKSKVEKSLFYD